MFRFSLVVTALAAVSIRAATAADVFAHFMVQNAWAYDHQQWKADMLSAKSIGVDAFAMNWMPPDCQSGLSWQMDRIDDAYKAAEEVGFKIVHSFDMSWTDCSNNGYWNTTYMSDVLQKHAGSKATYRWNSNILVTTFGGERVKQYGNLFFADLKAKMKFSGNTISFTPALNEYAEKAQKDALSAATSMLSDFATMDGYFNWQAWPMHSEMNNTNHADEVFQKAMKKAGKSGPYIMAVSPWQFKDLDNGNNMDAWVQPSDWLYVERLESIAKQEVQPDIIELLTWNDWCESHYLRDLPGNSTSSTDYADSGKMERYIAGQNHAPWRIITKYYIDWWKQGKAPEITQDQVVFWYRVHSKNAQCNQGSSSIRNSDEVEDAVFAWAVTANKARVSLSVGDNTYYDFETDGSGPATGSVPFPKDLGSTAGVRPEIAIMKNDKVAYYGEGPKPITSWCSTKNFNPVVGVVGQGSDNRGHS